MNTQNNSKRYNFNNILIIFILFGIMSLLFTSIPLYPVKKNLLKLTTYNVELWTKMFNITYQNNKIKSYELDKEKVKIINNLFSQDKIPHVMGVQESTSSTNGTDNFNKIGNLKRIARANAQQATYESSLAINSDGINPIYLTNELYILEENIKVINVREKIISHDRVNHVKRVLCIATLLIDNEYIITIGNVHLTGGRFDDKRALMDYDFIYEKEYEIKSILEENLDIFMGDFNLKKYNTDIVDVTEKWKNQLELEIVASSGLKKENNQINDLEWNYWTWLNHPDSSNSILKIISDADYIDATDIGNIKNTTFYGGQVDYIFVKKDKFIPISARSFGNNLNTSDHLIVEAIVQFIK